MISNQVLQTAIDDLKAIARIDMCIIDAENILAAWTFEPEKDLVKHAGAFMESNADSQVAGDFHFFKIYSDDVPKYTLIARGGTEDTYMLGRIAVSQIQNLIIAYKERFDKNSFIQNLLLDNFLLVDIYNKAKSLHIPIQVRRVVFLVEVKETQSKMGVEMLRSIFASTTQDLITTLDDNHIVLVKELAAGEESEQLDQMARTIVDMINTEAMAKARVAYGTTVEELKDVSKSYKEAQMALDVGKVFYSSENVLSYKTLGIGRLIYQLPMSLCEMFMNEVFHDTRPDQIDEETLTTVEKFFENNLNISETSRQLYIHRNTLVYRLEKLEKLTGLDVRVFEDALTFKIAMMVASHMRNRYNGEHE